jgi:LPXTG-motif cell wall-anchored protein
MHRNENGRLGLAKGVLVGGAAMVGAAAYLFRRRRRDQAPLPAEPPGADRRAGPTVAWLVLFSLASAVAIYADRRLKKIRDLLHA